MKSFKAVSKKTIASVLISCLLAGLSGCDRFSLSQPIFYSHKSLEKAKFEFQVKPIGQGLYQIAGETQLPEGSQIAVAALRYLKVQESQGSTPDLQIPRFNPLEDAQGTVKLTQQLSLSRDARPTYTILDYQFAEVVNGHWQTRLNLWQVAKNGQYQESWQIHQDQLDLDFEPEENVVFLATLFVDGIVDGLASVQQTLAGENLTLSKTLIHQSLEGEQYFQAGQLLAVDLPTGKTHTPALRTQDINGGWGRRYIIPPEHPNITALELPENRLTNSSETPEEFMN